MRRALVYGLAVAGVATARALLRRDVEVVAADDQVDERRAADAEALSIELIERPSDEQLDRLLDRCDLLTPAPGVPEGHRAIAAALQKGVPILSEIELAYRWEQERTSGPRPMLAVTGTDGKTTTTLLVVEMLRAAGLSAIDAGNTETPLVDAIERDDDAFVVECTSFRLAWTPSFRAEAAAWLNIAPDHLNWHASMETYARAKAQIFANQRPGDVAIGFADDPVVMEHLAAAPGRHRTFALSGADYQRADVDGEPVLRGPDGIIAPVSSMWRALPHDITNALAAAALAMETELADAAAVERALSAFHGPAHRLELVGEWSGVRWYNDSKATTPHAAAAAVRSFDSVVLIAGGYDKHVDLSPMATDAERVRAVIAMGDTGDQVLDVFDRVGERHRVADLGRAVDVAGELARDGDVVLLSPGCASFDHYDGFEARGDHFRALAAAAHTDDVSERADDERGSR